MNSSALKKLNKSTNADVQYHKRRMLIISDLDGSLLNNKGELDQCTVDTVKELTKLGHVFCLATGRPWRGSKHIYDQLGLKTILINLNGSYIWHPYDKDFLPINIVFQKDLVKRLLLKKNIMKRIDNVIVENRSGTFILKKPTEKHEIAEFNQWFHIQMDDEKMNFFGHDKMLNMEFDPNAILLQIRDNRCIDEVTYYLKETFNTFVIRTSSLPNSGNIVEINTNYANKGNAIDLLSSYYGIQRDSTIAFGDGENDLEMLQKARFGYAMKNGGATAKIVARYITKDTNNNHGVAHELIKKVLSRYYIH
ncbi:Cof-type HAD-IIB family hydrolase [[Mycoplasma] testudinis]|uniref:Cof-type HAD-IIB family hydrolase n=1 Tax=[Mycoplasma] testudinis TaxID=33924 RepID=UPI000A00895F|nr:Cof-type HAD-IIB family hydrolase [[Mycoplasma] testudinis]